MKTFLMEIALGLKVTMDPVKTKKTLFLRLFTFFKHCLVFEI